MVENEKGRERRARWRCMEGRKGCREVDQQTRGEKILAESALDALLDE